MRTALVVLALIHGVCHLPGFLVPWRYLSVPEQPYRTTILGGRLDIGDAGIRAWGLVWLMLAAAFCLAAAGMWTRAPWWLAAAVGAAAASFAACLISLPEAGLGLAANVLIVALAARVVVTQPSAIRNPELEALWREAPVAARLDQVVAPPEPAQLFLRHAIGAGTPPPANAARLVMHGEIKLKDWYRFHAEQVIVPGRGMIWAGTVQMMNLPVRGADRILNGHGEMTWKLFDLVPVAAAAGPDVSRSAAGRYLAEMATWLPAAIASPQGEGAVKWLTEPGDPPLRARVRLTAFGEPVDVTFHLGEQGQVRAASFPRWGNPGGGPYRYVDFGVAVEEERTFQGCTVPSKVRAGWYYGAARFEKEGEFFRATIDSVEFK